FPSSLLHQGDNDVQIVNVEGSWMIYDSVEMTAPATTQLAAVQIRTVVVRVEAIRALQGAQGAFTQPVSVTLRHFGEPVQAAVRVEGAAPITASLMRGEQTIQIALPEVTSTSVRTVSVEVNGQQLASRPATLEPVRKLKIYVLPHSHTDIGYTEIQTA